MIRRPPSSPLFPYTPLSRSAALPLTIGRAFVPAGPVVYYDEYLHAEATETLADTAVGHPCCRYEGGRCIAGGPILWPRSEEHTSELQSRLHLVCRLLLEKKK